MKYTKQQRHKIYKTALKNYKQAYDSDTGICFYLTKAQLLGIDEDNYSLLPERFPEFKQTMEELKSIVNAYWFPVSDRNSRIALLKKWIKETAPKKKTNVKSRSGKKLSVGTGVRKSGKRSKTVATVGRSKRTKKTS